MIAGIQAGCINLALWLMTSLPLPPFMQLYKNYNISVDDVVYDVNGDGSMRGADNVSVALRRMAYWYGVRR